MKKFIKFIPAALAIVALSSCSSDDLFGSWSSKTDGLKTLDVTVEQLNDGAITRSANLADGNGVVWQVGDEISVYDDKLFIYDPYAFDATAKSFVLKAGEDELLETPQFALFPTAYFGEGSTSWERKTDRVYVLCGIPGNMQYGLNSTGTDVGTPYVTNEGKAAYVSLLPMWGTASKDGDKTAVSLKYMTAILKVTLTNAQDNVKYLYIRGFKDIAGTQAAQLNGVFKAYLSESGRIPAASAVLEPTYDAPVAGDNVIEVDISNIDKATSVIYVPIPVGHYGMLDVFATNAKEASLAAASAHTITPAEKIYQFIDKDFEVKFYGSLTKKTYNVEGGTIAAVNNLLKANKDEAKDELVIDCSAGAATDAAATHTITLPNMAAGSVELKLAGITNNDVEVIGSEFSKKFILNLKTTGQNVTIDLPNADVVLAGDFNTKNVTVLNAKSLTIGDGSTTTQNIAALAIKAEVNGVVTVANKATAPAITIAANHRSTGVEVKAGGTAGNITVNASATVAATTVTVAGTAGAIDTPNDASTVTVSGVAGAITVAGTGAVTVSGAVAGNITMGNANAGALTISGAPYFDVTNDVYAKVNGNVTTQGDVEINLDNEGAAISGTLTMKRGKTLTLDQGYVMTIADPTGASGNLAVNLNTAEAYIAINSLSTTNVTVTGTTKWNGKGFAGSVTKDTEDATGAKIAAAGVTELATAWSAYADAKTAVWTAMGLLNNKGAFTLKNNIDLNNKAWTPAATTDIIDGSGKTISNLKIENYIKAKANKEDGLGLFSSLGHDVKNLIIDGVTINQNVVNNEAVCNVGALAGKTSADVTLTAVTVKNVSIDVKGKDATIYGAKSIGGIIGKAGGEVNMIGVQLAGTTNTIKGYCEMGGLIGNSGANVVTIKKKAAADAPKTAADVKSSISNLSFTANYNSATTNPAVDVNYLSVGNFIGVATGAGQITITDADNIAASDLNRNTDAFVGGIMKYVDGVNFRDYVFGQGLIGYCGDGALTKAPLINGKSYNIQTTKAAFDALGGNNRSLYYINK